MSEQNYPSEYTWGVTKGFAMTDRRDTLIDALVAELPAGPRPMSLLRDVLVWFFASVIFVVSMTVAVNPLRPGAGEQLFTEPRFALETLDGLLAIVLVGAMAFRFAIPAANSKIFMGIGVIATALWLFNYFVGIYFPTMEASMAGKREHCVWETGIYALPPLILGVLLIKRGYVLNWPSAGLAIGLASGFIPALLMQFACMYDAQHTLVMHIGPAIAVGLFGGLVGLVLQAVTRK